MLLVGEGGEADAVQPWDEAAAPDINLFKKTGGLRKLRAGPPRLGNDRPRSTCESFETRETQKLGFTRHPLLHEGGVLH